MIALPALAALTTGAHLVARRRGPLHLTLPAAPLTPTGRLPRGARPLCGQRALRWTVAPVDGRPLCRRCARHLDMATVPGLRHLDRRRLVDALAVTLRTARDHDTVHAATSVVVASPPGVMGALVEGDRGYPVRLTQLVKTARERLEHPASTPADRAWFSTVKAAPAARYPRRVG